MKEKTYTVHVTGIRQNMYAITAKTAKKAGEAAIKQFEVEHGSYWDDVRFFALADLHNGEAVNV